jgi:hypothetical protein
MFPARCAENQLQYLAVPSLASDDIDEAGLRNNRAALLQSIESARQNYSALLRAPQER